MAETAKKSSPALIAAAWLVVVVPAAWGLTFTVENALKIFNTGAKAPAAVSAPASPATPSPAAPGK